MLSSELKSKIDSLWNSFWANGMPEHVEALEHISYLIFMKKLEDYENDRIQSAKKSNQKYKSVFDGNKDMRWSEWKNYEGKKMLNHVKTKVFPFIKSLEEKGGQLQLQMSDANFEMKSPVLLQDAINVIDDLKIAEQNQDVQGDIFEYIVSQLKTAGLNGQFRTPRHIIRMMVELLDPDIKQTICDPACGTGGFLINAYQHIMKKYTSKDILEYDEEGIVHNLRGDELSESERKFLNTEQLYGFDFSNTMIRICIMNMILHGITSPNIHFFNSLGKEFNQNEEYHIIFANPPFAGNLNESEVNDGFKISTTKTELLFLELFYNKLNIGGRACVIVPDGTLYGSSKTHQHIRKKILENCRVDAVILMPSGVFKPYAGIATSVILFTKGEKTEKVWFYEMEHDGFSLDDKRIKRKENDIPDIIKKFKNKEISEKSWIASFDEIKKNNWTLSATKYKPFRPIKVNHRQPKEIIKDISKLETDIQKEINDVSTLVKGLK